MRVLVTGSSGKVGSVVVGQLRDAGERVVPFDLARGEDVRDEDALRGAGAGCDAVVHLAAVVGDAADERTTAETNVLGTRNVLEAARRAGARRVVLMSSANALGVFLGAREPDYLPIDDDHPSYASRAYARSKRQAEALCGEFAAATGTPTVCLRPPAVWDAGDYATIRARRLADPASEWTPYWEYGAFVDVRDVAAAALLALACPDPGPAPLLLCADDVSATRPSRELARRLCPRAEWRGGDEYESDPYRALLDTRRARRALGWSPRHRWSPRPTTP